MLIQSNVTTKNEYHLELSDALTGEIKQTVDTHNLVTTKYSIQAMLGYCPEPSVIMIGTGSGELSPSDRTLFKHLYTGLCPSRNWNDPNPKHVLSRTYPTATRTMVHVIPANACIGVLTECGLAYEAYNEGYVLLTHAFFTDAEGNPITINKTNTDILTVTAKAHYTFTLTPNEKEGTDVFLCNDQSNASYSNMLSGNSTYGGYVYALQHKAHKAQNEPACEVQYKSFTQVSMANGVYNGYVEYLYTDATGHNNGLGYDIRALHVKGIGTFNITEDIFPPTPFPRYQVGVGDGTNKEFNIKTPSCKEGTQKVYIDGVLKTEGVDYTFYPYNVKDFGQNYLSADASYATFDATYSNNYSGGPFYPGDPAIGERYLHVYLSPEYPIVYDFLEAKAVNCLYLDKAKLSTAFSTALLEYSIDGTTWTQYASIAAQSNGLTVLPEVTARYWRYRATTGSHYNADLTALTMLFGYYKPSITFTEAPAINAVIEVEYSLKYPFRNAWHSIRFNYTHEFQA